VPSPPFLQRPAGLVLRYALSLGLLAWLASRVDWAQLQGLTRLRTGDLLAGVLLAGAAYPLQAWRWQLLLTAQGIRQPARWVHAVTWIGQFYSAFLPGGVAGDAVRFGYLWRAEPERRAAGAASLVADRLLGLGALFALAALGLAAHARGTGELDLLLGASLLATILLLAGGWTVVRTRWWEPLSARLLGSDRAAGLHDAAAALGARPGTLAGATLLSVAVWLVDFASLWCLARAADLPAGPITLSVAAAAAYVAASLPLSIGGHGIREGSLVLVLGWLGWPAADHTGVPLLVAAFWTVSVGWSAAGGVVYALTLLDGRIIRPDPRTAPPTGAGG